MSPVAVAGGAAIAVALGIVAGTAYVRSDPTRTPSTFVLSAVTGGAGVALGLALFTSYRDLGTGLMSGGVLSALAAPAAARAGLFAAAALDYAALSQKLLPPKVSP